ncbi:MAG: Calx-beta domain-containing protein [Blastocatellia bacterium]
MGGKIYWSEVGSVGRANLDGTSANETFLSGLGVTWGIALADTDNEGAQATRTGTYSDADGDAVTLSANIGTVQKDVPSAGKWTWTYTPPDGPATLNVTITATDSKGAASTTSFTVNVNNIAPTATFAASSAKVNENTASPPTVSFTNPVDPGTPDATTLHYSYDYNNDGVWEVGDGTYAGSGTAASQTILASYFAAPAPTQLVVKGRIIDKDGGYTDYTATININHAPTAINGPLVIVEDFDYGNTGGSLAGQNGGAGFSTAWDGGGYTATGLTFSNLSSPGGAWNGSSGSRNFAKNLAAAGPITGDFLFSMNSAPGGRVQMFGLGGFNNQGFTLALAPANDSTPNGGIPIVGLQGGGFANITSGAVALNTTYLYRFAYANSSITAWILSAAQYDNFAPGGITDAELNVATIGSGATEVTGRVTKAGNVTSNMANLFTYTFGGSGVTMDRLRMTGQPVGSSLVIAENQPVNTTVGTLLASDPDANETHTFELVDSVNYPDNNSFTITGNTVKSNAVFNYEAKNSYSIRVKVTDSGGLMYETTLTVSITNVNEQPTVANTIANQTATAALPFNFTFAANTFADVDVPTNFTYTATKSNGSALPAWLTFTPGTRTFSGTPAVGDAGTFTVKVTATDDGAPTMFTSTTFDITVNTPTLSVSKSNPALTYLQNATYTITVTNTGAGAAATATVKDALPSGMKLVSATGTNWTCSPASGSAPVSTITCTFSSTANPIATSGGTSTINIVACPIVGGSLTNKVAVDPNGGTAPPNPTTCTGLNAPTTGCGAPITASVSGAPTETISKSGTAGATPVGGNGATTINWLINYGVSNTAPIPSVTLNDTWSSGQTLVGTSVLTPGGLWSTNQPNSTSLNFSNALVAPNGKGQTQAFPRPLANGVNLSGTGDGYNPAITANGKVIGINHHTANAAIWCYDLNTGAPCTGYPKSSGITTGTVNTTLAIGNRVYMNPDSYDGQCCGVTGLDNIYCWDATTDSTCGQSPATTGKSSLLTLANNKLFTLNQSGQLRCFDPGNGLNNCAGFTTVNLGMPGRGGVSSWEPYGDDMFAVGSKLYVANYERKLTCFDIATNTTCAGWPALPTVLTPAVPASGGSNLFPRLSAGGTITGICVAGTDTDATCYNLDSSNPVVVSLGGVHKMHPGLNANADVFVGSRVFFANFVYSTGLTCFDWATQAPCTGTGFSPAGFTNSTANNAYGLGTDGVSVFSYGDGAVLQSWNPLSGVTPSNRVATIATVNIDSFYCGATAPVAATWDKVMLSDVNLTAGVEFNSLLVSVIDTSTGTTVFGPTEAVGTSGVFDISGVSSALRTLRLQIDESPVNTVAWDDGVPPKGTLTFTNSTPVQFCYQTQVTCTGSGVSYTNTIATNIDARSATAQVTACAPSPNLALTKSDPSPSLLIGQNSTYTLTITNNGNANATTATVKDTLPTGLDLVSASGTNWTCAPSGATSSPVGTITCNFSGSMVKNGGTSTINIVAKPILGYGNSTVINYASVDPSGSTNPPLPTNCTAANTPAGCAAPVSSVIPPNSPPTINAGTTVMRAQGAAGSGATIATVSDNETAKKDLVVSVMSAPAGISVTSISAPDATTGAVTATVAAACNAVLGDNMVVLKVTDSGTLTAIANLTVNVTPHNLATTALSGQNVFAGATVMFSTTASGSGPYSFVWKKGATVLSSGIATNGATSTLTLTSVQAADAATYSVEVTGACTTVTQSATLGVTTPTLSINNVMKNEGNSGNTSFDFTVTLSPASTQTVTVNYATANHTATAPDDFTVIPSTPLTFQPNETMKTISVQVKGETTVETDEIFYLNLSSPANATLSNNQGTGTIINDDGARLSINDVTVTEGNSGTTNAVFNVTLDNPSALPITVKYATADQTATVANNDYTPVSNTLMFPPNSTLQTITVPVKGDTAVELNETFVVNLSGVSGAVIAKAQGTGTIKNDDGVLPDLTVGLIDPAVCLSPSGLVGVTATVFNPNNTTVNATWTAMFPTQLIGLIGSGTATVNQAGIQVTTTQVTWTGTLTAGQSVTFGYQAQIAANTPPDMLLCIQNTASFNGGTQVQVPECFVANCPATGLLPLANVRTSDQKAGSLLVFPYYTSRVATNSDTRLSITNTGTQQAYVHLFLVDGTSCDAADFFLCLTPNATASFKTSEYDPESTGFLYAVAVDTQGRPVPNNGLIGNAFVRDGNYVDNYAAEAFWRYDANPTTISNGVALLHLNGGIYDAAPMQFSVEIQSPLDTVGQRIVVAPISGDLTNGTGNLNSTNPTLQTAASQVGIGLASNEQEKTVSFSALLSGGCLKSAVIGTTFPRVPNGLGNLISTGKAGLLQFRVGAGVGLLMTPRTGANKWYGIRTLHKTAMTNTVIAIPVFIPVC